jgi:hypothetical protein
MHVNEKQHDPDLWREGALLARESSASARIQNPHPKTSYPFLHVQHWWVTC